MMSAWIWYSDIGSGSLPLNTQSEQRGNCMGEKAENRQSLTFSGVACFLLVYTISEGRNLKTL